MVIYALFCLRAVRTIPIGWCYI